MTNMRRDVFALPEGGVTFIWPDHLIQAEFNDIKIWFELVKRSVGRSVVELAKESWAREYRP